VINVGPPGGRQQPAQRLFAGLATALGPDSWAAAAKTTTALHTE
jgi:hypothetical protein